MAVLHHTGQPRAVIRCAPDDPSWLIAAHAAASRQATKIAAAGGINIGNAAAYAQAGAQILVTSAPYFARPRDVVVTLESG